MKSSHELKKELLLEGWLPSEVNGLFNARTPSGERQKLPNIDSPAYMAMRKSRIQYIADLTRLGWTAEEIRWKIAQFRKHNSDTFMFLKLSYAPKRKLSDLAASYKRSARAKITKSLGYIYGRRLKRATVRRRAPNRPMIIRRRLIKNEQ